MEQLSVNLLLDGVHEEEVGTLRHVDGEIYFKYHPHFLNKKINLSPFKLKLDDSIQRCPKIPFDHLFGIFSDSLPDGWGKLIVDRHLIALNKSPERCSSLHRLSFVGKNGSGALTYYPEETILENQPLSLNLSDYAEKALQILKGDNALITDEFYSLTGTSGGARPKIQVIYNSKNDLLKSGSTCEGTNESFWIIKFPSNNDLPDIAQIEYAYYLMAKDAGLEMAESKLFFGENKKQFFGTKRFDREGNKRIHLHSVAGLLHDDFRKSTLDYGHIMDAALKLERHKKSLENIMRIGMFNVLSANQDDHSKNFSFLMHADGTWKFAPAYDLTFSPNVYGFQTTSVASNNKNISLDNFNELGHHFQLSSTNQIWKQVQEVIQEWKHYARITGVSAISTKRIATHLKIN